MVSSLNGAAVQTQNTLVNPVRPSQDAAQQREAAEARREEAEENQIQRNEAAQAAETQQAETANNQQAEARASGDNGDEQRGTRLDITV